MSIVTRSAMLQIRVTPAIKKASDAILRRVGLNMTEAVELFLRRVIVDERLPFDVVALDEATLGRIIAEWKDEQLAADAKRRAPASKSRGRTRPKRE